MIAVTDFVHQQEIFKNLSFFKTVIKISRPQSEQYGKYIIYELNPELNDSELRDWIQFKKQHRYGRYMLEIKYGNKMTQSCFYKLTQGECNHVEKSSSNFLKREIYNRLIIKHIFGESINWNYYQIKEPTSEDIEKFTGQLEDD